MLTWMQAQVVELQVDLKLILEREAAERLQGAKCTPLPLHVDVEDLDEVPAEPVEEPPEPAPRAAAGCSDVATTGLPVECAGMTWGNCQKDASAAAIRAMCAWF